MDANESNNNAQDKSPNVLEAQSEVKTRYFEFKAIDIDNRIKADKKANATQCADHIQGLNDRIGTINNMIDDSNTRDA